MSDLPGNERHPGVAEALEFRLAVMCSQGVHSWVPWLHLDNGSWVTWCIRCRLVEQWGNRE